MPALNPPVCDFDWPAPSFSLSATDGRVLSFDDIAGEKGTLVMFICNHCPYVVSAIDRMARDARALGELGIGTAAICSNNAETHPADSFENMGKFADAHNLPFPYLHDEDQSVARAYGAVCTPDFFGFNAKGLLQYRGRLDGAGTRMPGPDMPRELYEGMKLVAETQAGPTEQRASIGCSIKWKAA